MAVSIERVNQFKCIFSFSSQKYSSILNSSHSFALPDITSVPASFRLFTCHQKLLAAGVVPMAIKCVASKMAIFKFGGFANCCHGFFLIHF